MSAPDWLLDGIECPLTRWRIERDYQRMQRASRGGRHMQAVNIGTEMFCLKLLDGGMK